MYQNKLNYQSLAKIFQNIKNCKDLLENIKVLKKNAVIYNIKEILKERIMGLAVGQIQLLTLTRRKADCEYQIAVDAMRKMQLSREMSQLTQEYNAKMSQKRVVYYDNGKYNDVNYSYLMGYGISTQNVLQYGNKPLKDNQSMILTDFKGNVVLSDVYANAIISVLGSSILDSSGRGGTFSEDKIPDILEIVCPGRTADQFRDGIESFTWTGTSHNLLTGTDGGKEVVDSTSTANDIIQSILSFFYPIFKAAANNGWTTEYNKQIGENPDYVSDAITTGTFMLAQVNDEGQYEPNMSLTYFATSGDVDLKTDSEKREELTQIYNAEKERIAEKETWIDMDMEDLSAELEAVKTEMDSIKSYVDDAIQSVFNWGNG